jgi:hypothetical protein
VLQVHGLDLRAALLSCMPQIVGNLHAQPRLGGATQSGGLCIRVIKLTSNSVVILVVDQDRVGALKREGQTPIPIHRHSSMAGQIILERLSHPLRTIR